MQGLSNLISSLPAAPRPPEVLQISSLSVNNVSTLEEYVVRTEHRHGQAGPGPRAEPGTPPGEAAFVPLDQLPISVCIDTAHGVACPWNHQAASLLAPRREHALTTLRSPPTAGGRSRPFSEACCSHARAPGLPGFTCMGAARDSDVLSVLFSCGSSETQKGRIRGGEGGGSGRTRPNALPQLNLRSVNEHTYSGAVTDREYSCASLHGSQRNVFVGCVQ